MQEASRDDPQPGDDGVPLPRRYFAMASILLGIFVSVLDSSIVNLALPDISRHFGASPSAAVWVVNAYQLAIVGLLLPFARLGERHGYQRVYMLGLGVFAISSVGCVFAGSLMQLAAARALQGVGAAGMMAVNAALVRLTYPAATLPRAIALNSVVVAVSAVAGPSISAVVLAVGSWRWLFIIQLPIVLAVWLAGRRSLPRNPRAAAAASAPPAPIDIVLNVLMFLLLFLAADLLAARTDAAALASPGKTGFALLVAGLMLGAYYLRRQWHQPTPLFPLDLLRIRVFALSMCTSVTAFAAQTLSFIALPFLLLETQGRSHFEAGLLITAWPAAVVVAAPIAGRLISRVPGGLLSGGGLAMMASGLTLLALLPDRPGGADMAWRLALCGLGFGFFQSPNNHLIYISAPLARSGAASGALGTARLTGQAIGALLLAAIFGVAGASSGAATGIGVAAALAAAAAVFSVWRLRG